MCYCARLSVLNPCCGHALDTKANCKYLVLASVFTATGAVVAATSTKSKKKDVWSALDGLWALLQRAAQLMTDQPMLLGRVLSVLSTLWECQTSAHGAVELLKSQTGFWDALRACAPDISSVSSPPPADSDELYATAWCTQVYASTLHIILLELLSVPLPVKACTSQAPTATGPQIAAARASTAAGGGGGAGASGETPSAVVAGGSSGAAGVSSSSSPRQLLDAWGPGRVSDLLLACGTLQLQVPLLEQLLGVSQVSSWWWAVSVDIRMCDECCYAAAVAAAGDNISAVCCEAVRL